MIIYRSVAYLAMKKDGLTITPSEIRNGPWEPFTFSCHAPTGLRPYFVFEGTNEHLSEDKRFSVSRPSDNEIEASAIYGLPGKSILQIS